jgi:peroxin-14
VPLIAPPTAPQLEADKAEVAARFDEAQQVLEEIKTQATELKESHEKQKQQVEEALEAVQETVEELKESGKRREADLRSFKSDIDMIRELIPKVCPFFVLDL